MLADGQDPKTRVILLGTAGGPALQDNGARRGPASVVAVGGRAYLFDAGEGVARRLLEAGFGLSEIEGIFITHHHFDHLSDLGNVLAYAWFARRRQPIDVWGPAPLLHHLDSFMQAHDFDFRIRHEREGKLPFWPLPRGHEVDMQGAVESAEGVLVMKDEYVEVRAFKVDHGAVPALAYRVITHDRDVVFSGDRSGRDGLAAFARGADTLVHEVVDFPAIEPAFRQAGVSEAVLRHLEYDHTAPSQVGVTATEANVDQLVLHHFVPSSPDLVSDDQWECQVKPHFKGRIVIGHDLMEI